MKKYALFILEWKKIYANEFLNGIEWKLFKFFTKTSKTKLTTKVNAK